MVTSEPRVRRDMGEDGKNKLVREHENCEKEAGQVNAWSKESTRELVLGLVWIAEEPRDFGGGTRVGDCFLVRLCPSLVKNVEAFPRY